LEKSVRAFSFHGLLEMARADRSGNVLVTGSTGFIGSNLVRALSQKGYSVTCLVRKTSDTHALQKESVRLFIGNLDDIAAIREAGRSIDTVYHLAGAIKAANRRQYFQINQFGTRHLLETLAEVNPGLNRFVHVSSLAAAGASIDGQSRTEVQKPDPISWYGESKLAAEEEVLRFREVFPVTILRPSAVYGPGDRETLFIYRMIQRGWFFTPGRHQRRFSLIHVDDLAAAIIRAGEQDTPSGEIFFLSRPESYCWEEVGHAIARALGKHYRQVLLPRGIAVAAGFVGDLWTKTTGWPSSVNSQKVKELLEPCWLCDSTKAQTHLGFSPIIDLETGIRQTARWYQSQGWL
jgi:dihydroflavonol-4-reductase